MTKFHEKCLRIFEKFYYEYENNLERPDRKGEFILKEVREDYTYVMLNMNSQNPLNVNKDYSIFICFDHRINNDLMRISKFLMDDIKSEEKIALYKDLSDKEKYLFINSKIII